MFKRFLRWWRNRNDYYRVHSECSLFGPYIPWHPFRYNPNNKAFIYESDCQNECNRLNEHIKKCQNELIKNEKT